MSKFFFIPNDWALSDSLRQWTKAKGISDQTIETELESFMDHQYKRAMTRPDSCWRNWIKNGMRWGNIETVSKRYKPEEITPEQRRADQIKGDANLIRLKQMQLKAVK